jgi:hypothetical protein
MSEFIFSNWKLYLVGAELRFYATDIFPQGRWPSIQPHLFLLLLFPAACNFRE